MVRKCGQKIGLGTKGQLKLSEETLEKISEWKNKDWDKYLFILAQMIGYHKSDIKGAKSFLKDKFVVFVDEELNKEVQDGINSWLGILSSHPSAAGIVFSVFTQYSGERYRFGEKGIEKEAVPEYYAIGRNAVEKLVYGILYWVYYLSLDVAASKKSLLDDMKIPKEVLKLLKE